MAASVRSSTKGTVATAQSITVNTPSGATQGDMLVAFVFADDSTEAWSANVPADWDSVEAQTIGSGSIGTAAVFRRILPSGSPPASYQFNLAGGVNKQVHGIIVCLNPDGGAFGTVSSSKTSAASVTATSTLAVTVPSGDNILLTAWASTNNRAITSAPASMTEQQFSDGGASDLYVYSQLAATAGSTTKSATWASLTSSINLALVYGVSPAGPTITVQPANDVGIISNGQSTVYTATATGTNVDAPTWSEDGTPISDGGIYDIVTTGAGTSSCSSTLTITRTVKTGTPFDIKAGFDDDNGSTDTNTVTDTWWTGPTLTTFPATDGSGESEATLTCDYVTGVGEAIEVRIPLSDGDVAVTVTTT